MRKYVAKRIMDGSDRELGLSMLPFALLGSATNLESWVVLSYTLVTGVIALVPRVSLSSLQALSLRNENESMAYKGTTKECVVSLARIC